ncbi:centrosome and spindle pole-associated protein 1-like [Osmerus eperlanus]|uniref:centrosome and spindle pole-associated protein 1-like n=1 Tax=Osmerus eperlanus TaxID=29151 RepID=UPI002E11E142
MFANQQTGAHWGHHLAESRGPWAEEGGPPFRESRLEPVERRAPTYQEELEQQIQEKQECRRLEKVERDRAEAKMEAEIRNYNPWGRGGCGAPLRDTRGDLISTF